MSDEEDTHERSRISAQVNESLLGELHARSQKDGVRLSDVIRSALVSYLGYRLPVEIPKRPPADSGKNPGERSRRGGNEPVREIADAPAPAPFEFTDYEGFHWADVRDPAQLSAASEQWSRQDRGYVPDPIPGTLEMAIPSRDDLSGFSLAGIELSLEQVWAHVDALLSGSGALFVDPVLTEQEPVVQPDLAADTSLSLDPFNLIG